MSSGKMGAEHKRVKGKSTGATRLLPNSTGQPPAPSLPSSSKRKGHFPNGRGTSRVNDTERPQKKQKVGKPHDHAKAANTEPLEDEKWGKSTAVGARPADKTEKISEPRDLNISSDEDDMIGVHLEDDSGSDVDGAAGMGRDEGRRKLLIINRKITEAAQRKQLGRALEEFGRLRRLGVDPTVHTYTSMINACVRAGETERAIQYMTEMEVAGVVPNEVTYTALLKGLAQDGDMAKVRDILRAMRKKGLRANVRTYDTVLRGCVRCGDSKMALVIWGAMQKEGVAPSIASYEYVIKTLCMNLKVDVAWHIAAQMQQSADVRQSPIFSYLAKACALQGDSGTARKALAISEQIMSQPAAASKKAISDPKARSKLLQEGALSLLAREHEAVSRQRGASSQLFARMKAQEVQRECAEVAAYLDDEGAAPSPTPLAVKYGPGVDLTGVMYLPGATNERVDFAKVFGNDYPVRMEICSGSGEWAVSRAKAEQGRYNWVANEIRFDRCYDIYARAKFQGVDNLLTVCGDGRAIAERCLPAGCVQELFVNFPEPPVWEGSKWRLLDAALFTTLHTVLSPGGVLHVLTDDEALCREAADELGKVAKLFKSTHKGPFSTQIPEHYSNGVESYFDRLWKFGDRRKRYYMAYRRL